MELEQAVFNLASESSEIAGLIGEADRLKFFRGKLPQGISLPASVIQRVTTTRDKLPCGTIRLVSAVVQIDHYARTPEVAQEVGNAFRQQFLDFKGMAGDVELRDVTLQNEFPLGDPEPGTERWSQSWLIFYVE